MRRGVEYIHQASLRNNAMRGSADLLKRIDQPSSLGSWSYVPIECKLASKPKEPMNASAQHQKRYPSNALAWKLKLLSPLWQKQSGNGALRRRVRMSRATDQHWHPSRRCVKSEQRRRRSYRLNSNGPFCGAIL